MTFELKHWEKSLAQSLAESANDERIAQFLRDGFPFPYSLANAQKFIDAAQNMRARGEILYAIVCDGKAVGGIGLTRGDDVCRKSAEIGYWLAPAYWGRGIMTEAVDQICREAFATTDIARIFAGVFEPNAASRRVLEKCGFTFEGVLRDGVFKRGRFYNSCMYSLLKGDLERK